MHTRSWRLSAQAAHTAWIALSLGDALRWRWATRQVAAAQTTTLARILWRNREAAYLSSLEAYTPDHFRARLPLSTYEEYAPLVARIGAGEPNLLTGEPVILLEPTSGTSGGSKLIPYTASLKREFQRGIAPWVAHTYLRDPRLWQGRAYWSLTPLTQGTRRSEGGIPIGFEEERDYFGGLEGRLIQGLMAVPPGVKWVGEMDNFRYVTLRFLLACPDLRLISVWNPTFLSLLLDAVEVWWPRLVQDIAQGSLTPPAPLSPKLHGSLLAHLRADPQRAQDLAHIFTGEAEPALRHARIWPRLRLLSCWADANAAAYAHGLARQLPQARLQPKGLLSTEAFVSFPLDGCKGQPLSLLSHFFEFIPLAPAHPLPYGTLLAHELSLGQRYEVAVTTGGGLYRYRTGDWVEVADFVGGCPCLRFVGRGGAVSDWFGEKLHEEHVGEVLARCFAQAGIIPRFALLACEPTRTPPAYALYLEPEGALPRPDSLAAQLDQALSSNIHYANCRALGQLGPPVIRPVQEGAARYLQRALGQGQRMGDIKPRVLDARGDWHEHLTSPGG
jgi:hypothetical protein